MRLNVMLALGVCFGTISFGIAGAIPRVVEDSSMRSRFASVGLSNVELTQQSALVGGWLRPTMTGKVTLTQGPAQPNGVYEAGQVARAILENSPSAKDLAQIEVVVQVVKQQHGSPSDQVLYSYRHVASPSEWERRVGGFAARK